MVGNESERIQWAEGVIKKAGFPYDAISVTEARFRVYPVMPPASLRDDELIVDLSGVQDQEFYA